MNIREYNESIHLSEWTKMVGECRNSGKTVKAWCSENGISASRIDTLYPEVGDAFALGDAEIAIYGPHPVAYKNVNDWSIVCMIRYAGRSILMTGDIEVEAEGDLLTYNDEYPLTADVLKVAHHGSDTSSTYAFIEAVSPPYAIVSCNSTEKREYPNVETAMTLVDCGVQEILSTEVYGDIEVWIDAAGMINIDMGDGLSAAA